MTEDSKIARLLRWCEYNIERCENSLKATGLKQSEKEEIKFELDHLKWFKEKIESI